MERDPQRTTLDRTARACIWMQAGVVHHRICHSRFDCAACRFDRALRRVASENRRQREQGRPRTGNRGKIVSWREKLRELPTGKRPCLHSLKERIEFRACLHDYRCANCEFDQYFNDQFTVYAGVHPVDVLDVHGVRLPQGYYLHCGHCWVKLEENAEVRIGLDDFALRVLGPFGRIEAPLIGKEIRPSAAAIGLRRGDYTAQVLAPVAGIVTDINPKIRDQGDRAGVDPYGEGWVLRAYAPRLREDLRALMIGEEAGAFLDREITRLYHMIEEKTGPLAADGGQLASDIFGNLPQLGWRALVGAFLRA
jgi:glycine cleavage system H lipoate-binding protein